MNSFLHKSTSFGYDLSGFPEITICVVAGFRKFEIQVEIIMKEWFKKVFVESYVIVIRLLRGFIKSYAIDDSAVILPPSAPGSLGDEALIVSLASCLRKEGVRKIASISNTECDGWSKFVDIHCEINAKLFFDYNSFIQTLKLTNTVSRYKYFCVLGADMIDGGYSEKASIQRILFAKIAVKLGLETKIYGFSFNKTAPLSIISALREIQYTVKLLARDPVSYRRLICNKIENINLSADLAFLLEPEINSNCIGLIRWIEQQKIRNKLIIGINPCLHKFSLNKLTINECVEIYASYLENIKDSYDISVVFLPHDRRSVCNDWKLSEMIRENIDNKSINSMILPKDIRAMEVKGICKYIDFIVSGRMHLLIAGLGQGVPSVGIEYQGKMEGLYEHFNLPEFCLTIDDFFMRRDKTKIKILSLIENIAKFKIIIENNISRVRELAEKNI